MFMTSRLIRAASPATQGAAAQTVTKAVEHLNSTHGAALNAGVQVGGDALAFAVTGMYEKLADYEKLRNAMLADNEFQELLAANGDQFAGEIEDTIWRSRIEGGEPSTYAQVSTANIELTSVAEAMAFCAEVATTVTSILGRPVGFATAATGLRSRILWVGFADSLDQIESEGDTLESSPDYMDLFKRSGGLIVANSLEQRIWHRIT